MVAEVTEVLELVELVVFFVVFVLVKLRGGIQKKKLVFFGVYPKGGGGSRRIQNFLIRK